MMLYEGLLNDEEVVVVFIYVWNFFGNIVLVIMLEKVKEVCVLMDGKFGFYLLEELFK